ncbi:MAG: hypothetical protein ABI233_06935 [Chthoniobacterales bacterium]
MSTLREIKAAAATLPAEERSELAASLSESEEVWNGNSFAVKFRRHG